jgi:23S rRNA G2445 N2-methylase RlmL
MPNRPKLRRILISPASTSDKIDKPVPRVHGRSRMSNQAKANQAKEVYKLLRTQSWQTLWTAEVPLFDAGTPAYRLARVGLLRALGVVALQQATQAQRALTKQWLIGLLDDPQEKVRRYAMAALPKLGGNEESERALLELLDNEPDQREMTHLSRTLDKVGGTATLEKLQELNAAGTIRHTTEQKVQAKLARRTQPGTLRLDAKVSQVAGLRIHLRTRRGLEGFVRDELLQHPSLKERFKLLKVSAGCVAIAAQASFSLGQLYQLRTVGSVHFVLGVVPPRADLDVGALAKLIASPLTQRLCHKLTDGQPRYRLKFMRAKVPFGRVQAVVNQAFALCPELLNDSRQAPWAIEVYPEKIGSSVELRPRVSPDPRFLYRADDVPASTHPPLAAAMAYLAGQVEGEVVWDPFCGSGLELIERALRGGVQAIIASDIDAKAVEIARRNLAEAGVDMHGVATRVGDFRATNDLGSRTRSAVTLMITNPPLGRRVRVADMQGLFEEIFQVAALNLCRGGRLVILNPLKRLTVPASLQLDCRHVVDVGGFECRLEKWVRV